MGNWGETNRCKCGYNSYKWGCDPYKWVYDPSI